MTKWKKICSWNDVGWSSALAREDLTILESKPFECCLHHWHDQSWTYSLLIPNKTCDHCPSSFKHCSWEVWNTEMNIKWLVLDLSSEPLLWPMFARFAAGTECSWNAQGRDFLGFRLLSLNLLLNSSLLTMFRIQRIGPCWGEQKRKNPNWKKTAKGDAEKPLERTWG